MDISMLKEFIVLADTCNYEEAAFNLFVTQSTLSKHIHYLEYQLGGKPLFTRGRNSTQLTEYGKKFYIHATQMLELFDDFMASSNNTDDHDSRTLHIGIAAGMDTYGLIDCVRDFDDNHPSIDIFLEDELIDTKLRSGAIDIGILFHDPWNNERYTIPLINDYLVPIVPTGHRLASCEKVSIKELQDELFILFPKNWFLGRRCSVYCEQNGFSPMLAHTVAVRNIQLIQDLVADNWGVSLVPKQEALFWDHPGIVILEPIEKFQITICIQYNKTHNLTEIENLFIEYIVSKITSAEKK